MVDMKSVELTEEVCQRPSIQHVQPSNNDDPYTISVSNLNCFSQPTLFDRSTKQILHSINAHFEPGTITGIVGASGSGKSTFLNVLAKRFRGRVTGDILYNGQDQNKKKLQHTISYMMATERFLPYVTPYEVLETTAALRLHRLTKEERVHIIEELIHSLGLQSCIHSYIDGTWRNTITPSQMKRLSIANCLIKASKIIILDEPTSGPDYVSENRIITRLMHEAKQGKTVIASIHRPSYQVFSQLNNVMFLKNGHIVYHGSASTVSEYFKKHGFPCPSNCNPCDYFIDVIQNQIPSKVLDVESGLDGTRVDQQSSFEANCESSPDQHSLIDKWMNSEEALALKNKLRSISDSTSVEKLSDQTDEKPSDGLSSCGVLHKPQKCSKSRRQKTQQSAPAWIQIFYLSKRSFFNSLRNPLTAIVLLLVQAMQGFILGGIFHVEGDMRTDKPVPLISDTLWQESNLIDMIMNGAGPQRTRPLLTMFTDGIDGKGSFALLNTSSTQSEAANLALYLINNYSTCLYKAFDLPAMNYTNLTRQYASPAATFADWTPEDKYSNALALAQIFDAKFVQESLLISPIDSTKSILKQCNETYEQTIPLTFYTCLLRDFKPRIDAFLKCIGLPELPVLDISTPRSLLTNKMAPNTRQTRQTIINSRLLEENKTPLPASHDINFVNDDMIDTIASFMKGSSTTSKEIQTFLMTIQDWLVRITSRDDKVAHLARTAYKVLVQFVKHTYDTSVVFFHLSGCFFFLSTIIGFAAYDALLSCHQERVIFNRETSNGDYTPFNYFVAKNLADLPIQLLPSLIMANLYYFLIGLARTWHQILLFYAICILTIYCAYGAGYLFSAMSPRMEVAIVTAPSLLIVLLLLSGFLIREVEIPAWIYYLKYFSFYRWSYYSFTVNQFPVNGYTFPFPNRFFLSVVGVQTTSLQLTMVMMLILGIAYRVLSFVFLVKANRNVGLEC